MGLFSKALSVAAAPSRLFTRIAAADRRRYGRLAGLSIPVVLLTILGGLAAIYLAWPVWRATLQLEIDQNEGWNGYFADAARTGGELQLAHAQRLLVGDEHLRV